MTAKTDTEKQTFLDELARTGIVADALRKAGISRPSVHLWRRDDQQFSDAYDAALEDAGDALEKEARRRAIEGTTRKRYDKEGNLIAEEIVYSDSLMALLLKGNKPEKFADRTKNEITNPDGSMRPESGVEAGARIAALLDDARRKRDAAGTTDEDELFQ